LRYKLKCESILDSQAFAFKFDLYRYDQVLGMLIAVLFAGQHTSSITSTWTGLLSIANKDRVMPALEAEQRKIMKKHDGKIDFDILAEMDELHFAIKEALRMHPPLIMLLRQCHGGAGHSSTRCCCASKHGSILMTTDMVQCNQSGHPPRVTTTLRHVPFKVTTSEGKDYVVPKGHIVATSPAFAHRMDAVFPDADQYKPGRFREPNPEAGLYKLRIQLTHSLKPPGSNP
jgi:sterol 14-demethylase